MLQPMDPDAHDKGKHKFMVQSMFAPAGVDDIEKMVSQYCDFVCATKFVILRDA